MKTFQYFLFSILFLGFIQSGNAQTVPGKYVKASLQASGLTCSMCSKAVKSALEEVAFVEKVQVDIKNQKYNLTFKPNTPINFDALSKAVEDAGFSVANFSVALDVNNIKVEKDKHFQFGDHYFHF